MGFRDTLFDIGEEVAGVFGSETSKQQARRNREDAARATATQRKSAMEQWRRVGRPGPPVAPEWLTDEDRKEMERTEAFQKVQNLRDKPILGSTTFNSILSPKRNTVGVNSPQGGTVNTPGADPVHGTPGEGHKPGTGSGAGGAFGNSVLSGRKRNRTILG